MKIFKYTNTLYRFAFILIFLSASHTMMGQKKSNGIPFIKLEEFLDLAIQNKSQQEKALTAGGYKFLKENDINLYNNNHTNLRRTSIYSIGGKKYDYVILVNTSDHLAGCLTHTELKSTNQDMALAFLMELQEKYKVLKNDNVHKLETYTQNFVSDIYSITYNGKQIKIQVERGANSFERKRSNDYKSISKITVWVEGCE